MTGYTNVFGGTAVQTSQTSYLALALSANTSLVWPLENQNSANTVSDLIDVTPSASGFYVTMPSALQGTKGIACIFNNLSGTYTFGVKDAGGNIILTVAVGTVWLMYLADNSTSNGTWRTLQYGAQSGSINVASIAGSGLKAISTSLNQSMPVSNKSSNYTVVDGDRAKVIIWSGGAGTLTLPSAGTVGTDWFFQIRNSGSGAVAVTPPSGLIDGGASKSFAANSSAFVFTDGTDYYTIGYGTSGSVSSFDYTTINVAGTGDYTISGAQLNRISYLLTGVLTGNRNFIVPASVQQYWINNQTTGAFTLTVKTAAGTGITVTQGSAAIVYCDGTNVVAGQSGVTTPIPVASGGTGATAAATARTNLGSTATGDSLFTAASAAAARSTLGSGTTGDSLFVASTTVAAWAAIMGASIPANGEYLPSANTIGWATNSTQRGTLNSTGNWALLAPSSGTTFALTAVGSGVPLTATDGTVSFGASFSGAVCQLWTTSSHSLKLGTNSVSRIDISSTGAVAINLPTSGSVPALRVFGAALTPTSTVSFSATPTFDALQSNVFELGALTANVTSMTINNPTAGQTIAIRVKQDGTGGRTVASPSGAKIAGSVGTTASAASILTLTYSSADSRWEGSWTNLPV